jgi:hypothetical protein
MSTPFREVEMSQGSLREQLIESNDEYRRLDQQHHDYETRLVVLADKAVLTDDEHVEEVTLKKKKLQLKDRMEEIARQVRGAAAAR